MLKMVTFDGDYTLYDDGKSLNDINDPIVLKLVALLKLGIVVAIITAAGYQERSGAMYTNRLWGLIEAVRISSDLSDDLKRGLVVMGGGIKYYSIVKTFYSDNQSRMQLFFSVRPLTRKTSLGRRRKLEIRRYAKVVRSRHPIHLKRRRKNST